MPEELFFMTIQALLTEFALDEKGGAIVLQGKWGVGKTHLWDRRILPDVLKRKPRTRYSYVSLFGINSLAELKTSLAIAATEFDDENPAKLIARAKKRTAKLLRSAATQAPQALEFAPKFGSQLAKAAERIGFYLIKNRLICIDDLERRGDGLNLRNVLGLTSFLAEKRNCRVLVILNDGQLEGPDLATWDSYREKVFRGEVTYRPTLEESIAVGLSEFAEENWHEAVSMRLHNLNISNIRLIRRTADFMQRALVALGDPEPSEELTEHIAHVLTMVVYSVHGSGDGAPPLRRVLREFTADDRITRVNGDDNRSAEEKRWDDLIKHYGVYPHTPLDHALVRMVKEGYPDTEVIRAARADFEKNALLYAQKEDWHNAFRLYHRTLRDNGDELVAAFERTWPPVSHVEHAHNMQFMVELLRLLGRSDLATRYINEWVDCRRRDSPDELDPRELHRFNSITDAEILAAVEAARDTQRHELTLPQAWERLIDDQYNEAAISVIANAPTEDLVALLYSDEGEEQSRRKRHVLELRGHHDKPVWIKASENVETACLHIARSSPFSAYRIKRQFGIEDIEQQCNQEDSH